MAKGKYRYLETPCSTFVGIKNAEKRLPLIGEVKLITGYRKHSQHLGSSLTNRELVRFDGEFGSARFGSFCWGYSGEGPRGLARILTLIGLSPLQGKMIAASRRYDDVGIDWVVDLSNPLDIQYSNRHEPISIGALNGMRGQVLEDGLWVRTA